MSRDYDGGPLESTVIGDMEPVVAPLAQPPGGSDPHSVGEQSEARGAQPPTTPHPAKFSVEILAELNRLLDAFKVEGKILDPFGGVGGIHQFQTDKRLTWAIEIEPEWASASAFFGPTVCADFFDIEFAERYTAVVTSPCVTPDMRVLTADLRWVPAGDLVVGDRLLAFDESPPGVKANGHALRRKYAWAEVTWAQSAHKECARVWLSDGSCITTTLDHPWLGVRSAGHDAQEWITTARLRPGTTQVLRQVEPWSTLTNSYDAGWLAGMFDGEGSLTYGTHGSPKMSLCQVEGAVNDRVERLLRSMGYEVNTIPRALVDGRRKVINTYVTGGWPGMIRALGQLRPIRLLDNFMAGDPSSRTIQPERVTVEAVEMIGATEIAGIETSTGTLIVEGYLHHNTYGNRMADTYDGRDGSKRITYTTKLGRPLTDGNSGAMQWGDEYRNFHQRAWGRVFDDALADDGLFLLNIKDHIRDGKKQPVARWHKAICKSIGFKFIADVAVGVRGMGFGANGKARVENEHILVMQRPRR